MLKVLFDRTRCSFRRVSVKAVFEVSISGKRRPGAAFRGACRYRVTLHSRDEAHERTSDDSAFEFSGGEPGLARAAGDRVATVPPRMTATLQIQECAGGDHAR